MSNALERIQAYVNCAKDSQPPTHKDLALLLAVVDLAEECSTELKSWVGNYYGATLNYPSEKRRHDNDIEPALKLDAALRAMTKDTGAA